MAILELLLILLKTIVLSAIYSTIILIILLSLNKLKEHNWIKKTLKRKLRFWLWTHFLISCGLLYFSFAFWHDTGIGDNSIIPIGYGQTIQTEDFAWTYFYPNLNKTEAGKDELIITNYIIEENKICAEVSHENTVSPKFDFIVYDLPTHDLKTFKNDGEYADYAEQNKLPQKKEFYNFEKHYYEYLDARPFWKTWLVP